MFGESGPDIVQSSVFKHAKGDSQGQLCCYFPLREIVCLVYDAKNRLQNSTVLFKAQHSRASHMIRNSVLCILKEKSEIHQKV